MKNRKSIPVIDLFAGPGGLGEGFSALKDSENGYPFKIALSIEKDPVAHKTLELRSFFRQFRYKNKNIPEDYYNYLQGKIVRDKLFEKNAQEALLARKEVKLATLGDENDDKKIDEWITNVIGSETHMTNPWVLIGGPPCQAYSLAGRSRNKGKEDYKPEDDGRHYLYQEYLRIIAEYWPAVFVMENVKGLLSARVKKDRIFDCILNDLENPSTAAGSVKKIKNKYRLFSLVRPVKYGDKDCTPQDFIVKTENYGIPQARHRIIIIGIREDITSVLPVLTKKNGRTRAWDVLSDLPELRSGISNRYNKDNNWLDTIKKIKKEDWYKNLSNREVKKRIKMAILNVNNSLSKGSNFISTEALNNKSKFKKWYLDNNIKGVINHQAKTHMPSDIQRYLFCSCYSEIMNKSPVLKDFPSELLPSHKNVKTALKSNIFTDRFRVQRKNVPATTITSHISKDGHYFIHPVPEQCRSLTVREAARLQTFPDNYFFCGPRTSQYAQVGNAVPPLLAKQIAEIVLDTLKRAGQTD